MEIPANVAPYFECCYILAFSICHDCGSSAQFKSNHPKFSDAWWLDEAMAMSEQGWVVSEPQVSYCGLCAQKLGIKHDPNAYTLDPANF